MRARRVTVAVLTALVLATIGICQVESTTLTHENGHSTHALTDLTPTREPSAEAIEGRAAR